MNNVRQVRVRNGSKKVKHGSKRSKMCPKKSQNATLEPDWRCGETTGKKKVQSGDVSSKCDKGQECVKLKLFWHFVLGKVQIVLF